MASDLQAGGSAGQPRPQRTQRLVEVDALRGIAALAVVFFHFTTRFDELFRGYPAASISMPYGHYGVNLFFIISGFVIFMTLDRTKQPMDFVVSRFSRLYPAYWTAIVLTFVITHQLGLPGKLVGVETLVVNFTMVQALLGFHHVDGVYWTLEVELLFYTGMFLLFRLGRLHQIHAVLLLLLALRMVNVFLEWRFGFGIPWTIYRLSILRYIPWFALGICIYLVSRRAPGESLRAHALTAGTALASLALGDSLMLAGLALVLASIVLAAALGRLGFLRLWPFVWLGSISYPLYLLHENIGWSVRLRLHELGLSTDLAILIMLALVLAMSTALTRIVEQPAMRWIRDRYKNRLAILAR